ncbi:MFS general substrate transporter [Aaosphaeria arxii CBS 175.79]|uniref:MFS general substrate transporter n=1 Tax=Aaosphaeria arxii CBS 175.79 TaxID=1450172 RepID=A0A6A5XTH3_9PLEO|nr:MFS general substrate transporter [Aaosphaeria arxii CBS 175.79]KAF2015544.1 MFS general substrate transporter [Aaosphaeria arxii CBS 175.79]
MAESRMDDQGPRSSPESTSVSHPEIVAQVTEHHLRGPEHSTGYPTANYSEDLEDKYDSDGKSSIEIPGLRSTSSRTIATESNIPASRYASAHEPSIAARHQSGQGGDDLDIEKQESRQPQLEAGDPNLVDWDGPDDPENPMNFSRSKKWTITMLLGFVTFCITFASSVFSTATIQTAKKFNVSNEVMVLGTSLFVLGFAVGPPIWGPLSELYGRKYPLFIGFFIFAIFQIPVAVAQNLQTIMLCRFFGGVFGSAPLGIVGGQLTDFWSTLDRGVAMTIFAGATFIGPVAGPIIGGFIVQSHLGWRWTEYITAIMAFFFGAVAFIFVPETFGPVLLSRRAQRIRFETRNWAIHAKADEQQVDLKNIAEKYLLRPFVMLIREPILDLVTLYMALIYGILYLFFEAYPIAFQEERGWNSGVGALPFLSITIGVLLGGSIIVYLTKTRFARKIKEHGHLVPEERLIPMIIGGALFPIGMFWFAWTSNKNITWVPQVLAGIPIGAGVLMIFLQGLNYIIDVYLMYANSAIAGNTFIRSLFGAGFPLFATAMYHTLGVNWATSLLAFLTAALFPVPILFYIYGAKIRKLSKYSPTA